MSDVTITGVPVGASLNLGTDNGDGSYTIAPRDLPNRIYAGGTG